MTLIRKPKRPKWRPFVQIIFQAPQHESWRHFVDRTEEAEALAFPVKT
jgi:hypothetical protein